MEVVQATHIQTPDLGDHDQSGKTSALEWLGGHTLGGSWLGSKCWAAARPARSVRWRCRGQPSPGVPQLALQHLAGTARGQWYVGDVDDLGDLVARDQLPAVREQLVHGDGRTRDRDGVDGLAPPLGGVGKQRVVLAGIEADDVLDEGGKRPGVAVGDQDTAPESARASRGSASTWRVLSGTSTNPGGRDGPVELEVAVAVQRRDGDPVAALQAQLHEGAGDSARRSAPRSG